MEEKFSLLKHLHILLNREQEKSKSPVRKKLYSPFYLAGSNRFI
jgi:hypothetical protein